MKYNYVFFNIPDNWRGKDLNGYYTISVNDLNKLENVQIVSTPLENKSGIIRILKTLNYSSKINKYLRWRKPSIWYPYWVNPKFKYERPICFVFNCCGYEELGYIKYLYKTYPSCRIAMLQRDLVKTFLDCKPEFEPYFNNKSYPFDLLYTYDPIEADIYKANFFMNYASRINVDKSHDYPLSDVFFAGRVKNRMSKLIAIYDKLVASGIRVSYYLVGVPKKEQKKRVGIVYANKMMSYRDMLYKTVNSSCVLDLNQCGAVGYTARFMEAIMYNKKLITDNKMVLESKFYNPQYILYVNDISDINPEFVCSDVVVDYHYQNEFSPLHLIEQIDADLCELDEKQRRL